MQQCCKYSFISDAHKKLGSIFKFLGSNLNLITVREEKMPFDQKGELSK